MPVASVTQRKWQPCARNIIVGGLVLFAAIVVPTASPPAAAESPARTKPSREQPLLLTADAVTHDPGRRTFTAEGRVEVSQGGRVLKADTVRYDEGEDRLTAEGNVVLIEPTGEVAFARSAEITGDLKAGVVDDLRLIFADGARLAANQARRQEEGLVTEMDKGVYSPCALCSTDPSRPPLWQVKAVKIRHDKAEKIVEFADAWMEIDGVPVFYLPYFYQPDPTVKRKTGLLMPTFGQDSDLGFLAKVPVYWAIGSDQDLTLTPWLTTKEGPVLEAEYRRALQSGEIEVDGSLTRDSRPQTRGHIVGRGRYDIDPDWRAGIDVQRALDRTYMRRYGFGNQQTLTSRLFAENFGSNHYFVADSYLFQGLKSDDDNDSIPVVLPKLDYFYASDIDRFGGRTDAQFDLAVFSRDNGTDTQRASARADWSRPMLGAVGDLHTLTVSLWGDLYHVTDLELEDQNDRYTGMSGRLFPQMSFESRLPLVRDGEDFQQVVEPIVEAVLAPNYGNPSRLPNEDSEDLEFDDTNVFGLDRYGGLDRVEKGPRVNYGMSWSLFGPEQTRATLFAGQSYRFFEDHTLPQGSGLEGNVSDVVTAIDLAPARYLDLIYRNRINVDEPAARRHELSALMGPRSLRIGASYVRFDNDEEADFPKREELKFSLSSQLTRYWRTRLTGTRDLTSSGAQRELGIRFTYEDECFLFTVGYAREDIEDRDIEPRDVVFVRFGFKTLGDLGGTLGSREGS